MKRLSTVVVLVFGLFLATASQAAARQSVTLLHVNDTHSHLDAWGPKDANLDGTLGGLPKAAAIIASERAADPNALFVHSGDFMNGDLFFSEYRGAKELQLLQSLGLDAYVPGNNEFMQGILPSTLGRSFLKSVLNSTWPGGAGLVPMLGTNLKDDTYAALSPWVTRKLTKDVNGVKIGFCGLTGSQATDPVPAAAAAVAALHAAGAQVVICVSHFGMDAARALAGSVSGIDVIVNGHDNAVLEQPEAIARPGGGTTLIVSAGLYYRYVGRLRLQVDGTAVSFVDYALLGADADTPSLSAVQQAVEDLKGPIVARYGDVYHQPLAWAAQDIVGEPDPAKAKRDTPLGNLFTDAYRAATGTDVAFEASVFLRDALPRGPIVGADVFRSMPFGLPATVGTPPVAIVRPYRLVTFRTTGSGLIAVLQATIGMGGDYFPQVSGMRLKYDSRLAPGSRVLVDSVLVGDERLVADRLYSVTVTEGVFAVLKTIPGLDPDAVTMLDTMAFDAARALVVERGELGPAASNRIQDIGAIPGRSR
jgi:2',3'-cyclic-nucleotide 2'-phosphodiesterase (5'-nucleotidase family)